MKVWVEVLNVYEEDGKTYVTLRVNLYTYTIQVGYSKHVEAMDPSDPWVKAYINVLKRIEESHNP